MRQIRGRAPQRYRPGASFLQRGVVEERIGIGVEDLVGHGRGCRGLHRHGGDLPSAKPYQRLLESIHVHGFPQAVVHGLPRQRMVRQAHGPGAVVLAHHLVGEDRAQQVLRAHALDLHGDLLAPAESFHRQRPGRVPAPAVGKHRRCQGRLGEVLFDRGRVKVGKDRVQGEGVAVGQRDHDAVVSGRGLELEIEVDAEPFA